MTRSRFELRPITITADFTKAPLASILYEQGQTRIFCTASVKEEVPPFRSGKGGWLTAEYGMLPGSSPSRIRRPIGQRDGRQTEIQRLIGRSLRAGFRLEALGERSLTIDCDVLEADGGTRTASITAGWLAAAMAIHRLHEKNVPGLDYDKVFRSPITAISVGLVDGEACLDLDYALDSRADVDLNVVMNHELELIEIQGTAEGESLSRQDLNSLLDLAEQAILEIREQQRKVFQEFTRP